MTEGVLFLNPSRVSGQNAPVASWISQANWAKAAGQLWGASWVVTPEGTLTPEDLLAKASDPARRRPSDRPGWKRWVPDPIKTALKDIRKAGEARAFREAGLDGPWQDASVRFVWQRHDLFHEAGLIAAAELQRPLVLFVPALIVSEARTWGVPRTGYGRWLERIAERPQVRAADLVACGSIEIAEQVLAFGVPTERVLVTPNGVDPDRFSPDVSGERVLGRHGLEGRFVVGWVGSFRRFHGLDMALDAVSSIRERVPDLALLLVGDGLERPRIESLIGHLGLDNVVLTGTVPFPQVPDHVAAMDTAVITDLGDSSFHYSPLKLREYMAAGKPVVAPRIGEMGRWLTDGEDALLFESGDTEGLAAALTRLASDPSLRRRLGVAARAKVLREATWTRQLEKVDAALQHSIRVTGP